MVTVPDTAARPLLTYMHALIVVKPTLVLPTRVTRQRESSQAEGRSPAATDGCNGPKRCPQQIDLGGSTVPPRSQSKYGRGSSGPRPRHTARRRAQRGATGAQRSHARGPVARLGRRAPERVPARSSQRECRKKGYASRAPLPSPAFKAPKRTPIAPARRCVFLVQARAAAAGPRLIISRTSGRTRRQAPPIRPPPRAPRPAAAAGTRSSSKSASGRLLVARPELATERGGRRPRAGKRPRRDEPSRQRAEAGRSSSGAAAYSSSESNLWLNVALGSMRPPR